MKLIRFGEPGQEKPGLILNDGRRIDASGFGSDYDENFFASDGLTRLARWNSLNPPVIADDVRLGPPVAAGGRRVTSH